MKKKILLTFMILTVFALKSFSQAYIPLLNKSSWNIQISTQIGPQYAWIEQGVDTVIGAYTYKKFIDIDFSQTEILIREDVAAKKVYKRLNNNDVLLFDFSLQVGNQVTLGNGYTYTVSAITNIDVNGGQRRLFHVTNQLPFLAGELWIEGVGGWDHPLKSVFELPSDPAYNIRCSYQDGVTIFNFGLANGGTPTTCPAPALSIENPELVEQATTIFPNPFSQEATLKLKNNMENGNLEIYNSIGQKVKEIKNINSNQIVLNRENMENGIYLLVLKQNEKIFETKKIILKN